MGGGPEAVMGATVAGLGGEVWRARWKRHWGVEERGQERKALEESEKGFMMGRLWCCASSEPLESNGSVFDISCALGRGWTVRLGFINFPMLATFLFSKHQQNMQKSQHDFFVIRIACFLRYLEIYTELSSSSPELSSAWTNRYATASYSQIRLRSYLASTVPILRTKWTARNAWIS